MHLLSTFGISASAVEYAYSIGHDFGIDKPFVSDYEGDFTENVSYAATVYGMLGYKSYYNYNPDYNYLRGKNPGSADRLGSSVIFLNSHAAYNNILCGDTVDDDEHRCGVHRDTDFTSTSSGYTYAGLESWDLSNVKLISFVGCNTASTDDNLCTKAVKMGADCAIGFTSNIHSRTSDGKKWLVCYHNALANGSSVEEAIDAATTAVPNSDLGDFVDPSGDPGIKLLLSKAVRSNTATESLTTYERFCNVVANSQTTNYQIDIDVADVVKASGSFDFALVETNRYIDLSEVKDQYQDIISIMAANDPDFDMAHYANEYADNTGIIKLRYYIDDIQTSAVTVFEIEYNGNIFSITNTEQLSNLYDHLNIPEWKRIFDANNDSVPDVYIAVNNKYLLSFTQNSNQGHISVCLCFLKSKVIVGNYIMGVQYYNRLICFLDSIEE